MEVQNTNTSAGDDFQLPYIWLHEGRAPLAIIKGFVELYLDDKIGDLNSTQLVAMQKIDDCTRDVIEKWNEFQSFFHIGFQYNQSLSADALSVDKILFLQENVINRALSSMMTIKEQIELLLKDMARDISDEDQEALDAIYTSCLYAIERWNEPLQYFKKSRE